MKECTIELNEKDLRINEYSHFLSVCVSAKWTSIKLITHGLEMVGFWC